MQLPKGKYFLSNNNKLYLGNIHSWDAFRTVRMALIHKYLLLQYLKSKENWINSFEKNLEFISNAILQISSFLFYMIPLLSSLKLFSFNVVDSFICIAFNFVWKFTLKLCFLWVGWTSKCYALKFCILKIFITQTGILRKKSACILWFQKENRWTSEFYFATHCFFLLGEKKKLNEPLCEAEGT